MISSPSKESPKKEWHNVNTVTIKRAIKGNPIKKTKNRVQTPQNFLISGQKPKSQFTSVFMADKGNNNDLLQIDTQYKLT